MEFSLLCKIDSSIGKVFNFSITLLIEEKRDFVVIC